MHLSQSKLAKLAAEIDDLRREAVSKTGREDLEHLFKIERAGRLCTALGYATAWIAPNPISAFLLAQGLTGRLVVGHHVSHGAYERVAGLPERYRTSVFAKGDRKIVDWIEPWDRESWLYVHNSLHHPCTGDERDPDLMAEQNFLHLAPWARYAALSWFAMTWKWFYYPAYMLRSRLARDAGYDPAKHPSFTAAHTFDVRDPVTRRLWWVALLPYAALHFVLAPALFLVLGPWAAFSVFVNAALAEVITNVQGFVAIRSNHSADDIPLFRGRAPSRGEYYLRQIVGTANYAHGGDALAFLHVWTNYQIEHHVWPNLSLLKYRQYAPKLRALCHRYGLPYRQQSVWQRFKKTIDLYVGRTQQDYFDGSPPSELPIEMLESPTQSKRAA